MRLLGGILSVALVLPCVAAQNPPTQQNPAVNPPLPIIPLSSQYIGNATLALSNPQTNQSMGLDRRVLGPTGAEICAVGEPCADGSCCSTGGICGYGPAYCGNGNCTSNCDALAMCGIYSDSGGTIKCGMNLCCSHFGWCGTDANHCGNPDPNGLAPCQEDFGLCQEVPPPGCGKAKSTDGRRLGYYQASNTRDRICNKISPSQINTTGYTHLYFAFAKFDPTTFQVGPTSADDIPLYKEFNALAKPGLQTWIAVGGFDFSDNTTSTHTAWSNMTSTAANRATFISGLKTFMSTYGFQGVDLDWEYPGTPERGGQRADTENFAALVKEMRTSFGTQYGISLTLAPDYWYLRWFDAKAMESSVDFFGFMAYDLHGSWDADVKTLGAIVRGQTDIRDIGNDTAPLWFDALDPAKINFGVAYYGRGYTLADPSCNTLGCPFAGPSKSAPCTNYAGVASAREIENIITEKGLTPRLLPDAMMKEITWADQWIGYDDAETITLKKAWADKLCFGGTMAWSVDFSPDNGAGSGDTPPSTTDGSCGAKNGGTVCGDWPAGNCCSSSGFCGAGDAYCGNGCQSGDCIEGGVTTDGTCGVAHEDSICGDWANGDCCSSSGFCGNTTAHCGTGCQSGSCDGVPTLGSGDVFISPDVFTDPDHLVACYPPCTFILPPWSLSTAMTISPTPVTLTLEGEFPTVTTGSAGVTSTISITVTIVTTVTIPPVTTSTIPVSNVVWNDTQTSVITFWSSIDFPPVTLTVSQTTVTTSSKTTVIPGGFLWTYNPQPGPTRKPTPIAPPGLVPTVKPHVGPPKPKCKLGQLCGPLCKHDCIPDIPCIGICGCIGPLCPDKPCIGHGCHTPGGSGGGGGGGEADPSTSCEITSTVTDCLDTCSETTLAGGSVSETCISRRCYATYTGCDVIGTTETTTITDGCPLLPAFTPYWAADPDQDAATLGVGPFGGFVVTAVGTWTAPNSNGGAPETTTQPTPTTSNGGSVVTTNTRTIAPLCTSTNLDSGGENYQYCTCGSAYPSTLPLIPSTTEPCGYTVLPTPCRHGASPQQGKEWCNCDGYPHTLPTLTTSDNQCGYTSFPAPWPWTATDPAGDIIACETSTLSAGQTWCAGDYYTVSAAPPAPTAKARCITGHTYMSNCAIGGDDMYVQVWENGVQTCMVGKNIYWASDETEFSYDCGDSGAKVVVTDNGASLVYTSKDGWQSSIPKIDGQRGSQICGYISRGEIDVPLRGFEFEYAFATTDQCGKCPTAGLCDWDSNCKFDGTCN